MITETTLPACDAASKEPGCIKVGFAPGNTRSVKASGQVAGTLGKAGQKLRLPGDYRLRIDGLGNFRLEAGQDANDESAAPFSAGPYCEKTAFFPGKPGPGPISGK